MCRVVSFYKISKVKSFLFNKYKQTYYIEIINRFHCMNCFAFDITNSILWSNRSTYKKRKRFKPKDVHQLLVVRENRYFHSHILTYLNCMYSVDCNPNSVYSAKIYLLSAYNEKDCLVSTPSVYVVKQTKQDGGLRDFFHCQLFLKIKCHNFTLDRVSLDLVQDLCKFLQNRKCITYSRYLN